MRKPHKQDLYKTIQIFPSLVSQVVNFRSTTSLVIAVGVLALAFGQQTGKPDINDRVVILEKQVIALDARIDVLEAKLDGTYQAGLPYDSLGVPMKVTVVDPRNAMVYLEDGSAWVLKPGSPGLMTDGYKSCFVYANFDRDAPFRLVLENEYAPVTHVFARYIGGKKKG